jgi:hypothetical protein
LYRNSPASWRSGLLRSPARWRFSSLTFIALADLNVLDLSRSRRVEQEVLDLLDEPFSR